ncbi:MAG TPA: tripartite tricarboxylate transporter substrate binding protein [Xanthobacteraceae bacterium]|jgi:tripartite-type tricarboxylate transporter receptor subunit TctC
MKLQRRQFLYMAAGAATLSVTSRIARAQAFPTRPVTLVVPFVPGGSTDVTFRSLAQATEKYLGQSIVIENRAGADGTLGPAEVAMARADGYTITQILDTTFRAPFLRRTPFDPAKDFTYIIGVTGYTWGLVVRSDAPWATFQQFLAYAKANPGKISYATTGAASTPQIAMELIARQQGIKWVAVPFRGNAEQITALLGGHIDAISSSTGWAPQVKAGKFRLLITYGAHRTQSWPDVPTLREVGIDMAINSPYGIGGPRAIDPSTVKILHDAFKKGMAEPSFASTMRDLDQEFIYMSSEEYRNFALEQIAQEKKIVEELGLRYE